MISRKYKATLAAAFTALLAAAVVFGLLGAFGNPFKTNPTWLEAIQPKSELELQNSDSQADLQTSAPKEYLARHIYDNEGRLTKTEITYANQDTGIKLYSNERLSEWIIEFQGGGTRLHAYFTGDGKQIASGFALRSDRTQVWQAKEIAGVIETTTFYADGKTIFSIAHQGIIGKTILDTRYYRQDRTQWAHQVKSTAESYLSTNVTSTLDELYDENGKLLHSIQTDSKGKIKVTYFRADGTRDFVQNWEPTWRLRFIPEAKIVVEPALKSVDEYTDDGANIKNSIGVNTNRGGIKTIQDGATSSRTNDLLRSLPTPPDPVKYWNEQEPQEK